MRILIALALTVVGHGALAEVKPIPNDQLVQYKNAVLMAIHSQELVCKIAMGQPSLTMNQGVSQAMAATIEVDGAQPLLHFIKQGVSQLVVTAVTTSADYRKIVSIHSEESYLNAVNSGDLRNPKIEDVWKLESAWSCVAK